MTIFEQNYTIFDKYDLNLIIFDHFWPFVYYTRWSIYFLSFQPPSSFSSSFSFPSFYPVTQIMQQYNWIIVALFNISFLLNSIYFRAISVKLATNSVASNRKESDCRIPNLTAAENGLLSMSKKRSLHQQSSDGCRAIKQQFNGNSIQEMHSSATAFYEYRRRYWEMISFFI